MEVSWRALDLILNGEGSPCRILLISKIEVLFYNALAFLIFYNYIYSPMAKFQLCTLSPFSWAEQSIGLIQHSGGFLVFLQSLK